MICYTIGSAGSGDDLTTADVQAALEQLKMPFEFRQYSANLSHLLTATDNGIYLCLVSFLRPDTKLIDKHYIVVDCERKIILDNSLANPISFLTRKPKQLRKAMGISNVERVWQVRVAFNRRHETNYI